MKQKLEEVREFLEFIRDDKKTLKTRRFGAKEALSLLDEVIGEVDSLEFKDAEEEKPSDSRPVETTYLCRYKRYKPQARKQGYGVGRWQVFNGYGWSNADYKIISWREADKKPEQSKQ